MPSQQNSALEKIRAGFLSPANEFSPLPFWFWNDELTEAENNYVPMPGDYIYFRWKNAAKSVNVSHVGIVAAVDGCVTTWEGNVGGKVVTRSFALDDAQIVGYGHPRYSATNTHTCNCAAA